MITKQLFFHSQGKMHDDYMIQIQTLINQKFIESSGAKKGGDNFGNAREN